MKFISAILNRMSRRGSFHPRSRSGKVRLRFESLEDRRLLAATDLRLVTYNALNFDSNSGNRQDDVETVFAGLEADVVVVQEVNTNTGANILLNALNGGGGQQYARADFIDGNDTDLSLIHI